MTPNFSVIITTYDVPELLLECLESFDKFQNIEILVGIDGCENTKNKLVDLERKKNTRFFYFTENCGTYNVKNNLIKETKSNIILFFDSDDIVCSEIFERYDINYDITKLKFENFGAVTNKIYVAQGVFFIKKNVLEKLVGFQNWICNADIEFTMRSSFNKFKIKEDDLISFKRRRHNKNLTTKKETNMQSELRQEYVKIITNKHKRKDWSNPKIEIKEYYEI
jgi:glycosyltransferase involved in cell wall biosynthesis